MHSRTACTKYQVRATELVLSPACTVCMLALCTWMFHAGHKGESAPTLDNSAADKLCKEAQHAIHMSDVPEPTSSMGKSPRGKSLKPVMLRNVTSSAPSTK